MPRVLRKIGLESEMRRGVALASTSKRGFSWRGRACRVIEARLTIVQIGVRCLGLTYQIKPHRRLAANVTNVRGGFGISRIKNHRRRKRSGAASRAH